MDFYIYLICLCVGFFFTVLSALFGHFFGGHEGHVDGSGGHAEAGADASDMPGISALSPTVIACFVTAFGGLGIIFREIPATRNTWVSAPLAVAGSTVISYIVLWILRKLFSSTQSSSESKVADVVGMHAQVISPIPENGFGEIAYVHGGSRYTAPAREETGVAVPNGREVRVVRVVGSQFYVTVV